MARSKMVTAGKVVAALGVAAVAFSSPAAALNLSSSKDDAVRAYSYGTNTRAAVDDTKQDGNSVYVRYSRNGSNGTPYTLHNKGGAGTTATSGSGNKVWMVQACISLDWSPDRCDSERTS
ncbi:hypothetical protein ACFV0H_09675 [Streptomyces erythrochromogenes]|uniref:hypothetical protein n=1 Tax=Streptomyces erythrochromogenes TaxID=285574 RepID=UPI0036777DE0